MSDLSKLALISGPVWAVFTTLGVAALLWLLLVGKRYVLITVPLAVAAALTVTAAVWFVTERVWNVWGAPQPLQLYVPIGLSLLALALAAPRFLRGRRIPARLATAVAVPLVLLAAAVNVNAYYGNYPTLGTLTGTGVQIQALPTTPAAPAPGPVVTPTALTTEASWNPPPDMPTHGTVAQTTIPGTVSGVKPGGGFVWLPPAYLASPRAVVPVLVLLHGVPGGSMDWIAGGQLPELMDAYAAAHKGLAPIIVMPDANQGSVAEPTLCMDTSHGKAATYLAADVPGWIKSTLDAGHGSARNWAVAGFSYGGTCALQLAVNFPAVFPTFIDISGENAPTIPAGQQALINGYFNGDAAAFARQNPLDVLKTGNFPDTAGLITVGAADSFYKPQGEQVYAAAKATGMNVTLQTVPGSHTWQAWRAGLANNLDWLMQRYGVVP
ncbi:alpha/beta hydrolase [Arthrobacter sp. A5]|uniref:alpha/beta hydrolase n=1 Tax=Arthrobacter sp. A5 TaxID=576926 RepID=UPI003DA8D25A